MTTTISVEMLNASFRDLVELMASRSSSLTIDKGMLSFDLVPSDFLGRLYRYCHTNGYSYLSDAASLDDSMMFYEMMRRLALVWGVLESFGAIPVGFFGELAVCVRRLRNEGLI